MENEPLAESVPTPIEPAAPPLRWTGADIAMAIGFAFAAALITMLLAGLLVVLRKAGGKTTVDLLIITAATGIAFLGASIAVILSKGYTLPEIGFGYAPARLIGRWLLWAVAGTVIVTLSAAVLLPFGLHSKQNWRNFAPEGFTWLGAIGMTLIAGVAAPFYEEFFFRGMLFHWLRDRSGFWIGALVSSFAFGLVHFDIVVGLGTFVMGMLSCAAYHQTGSMWPSFLLHSVNNTLKVVGIYVALAFNFPLPE